MTTFTLEMRKTIVETFEADSLAEAIDLANAADQDFDFEREWFRAEIVFTDIS